MSIISGEVTLTPPLFKLLQPFLCIQKNLALFIVIIILCFLFLVLIAIVIIALLWRRDKDKAQQSAHRAVQAAEEATAAAKSATDANRELHAIIVKQQQQLASVGVEAEAVPLLPPAGPPSDPKGGIAPAPIEGTKEWMATGDFVSNTYYGGQLG